jgi:hypothetical protein
MRTHGLLAAAAAALLIPSASAPAAPTALPSAEGTLHSGTAAERDCSARSHAGSTGVATTRWTAPISGFLNVRSAASDASDWDLAVFDAASGRRMASSNTFGSHEVAQTFVGGGQQLLVQGCRESGGADDLGLTFQLLDAVPPEPSGTPSAVTVAYRHRDDLRRLDELGLDVTHHIREGTADVLVADAGQRHALEQTGLPFTTKVPDMNAFFARSRAADARYAAAVDGQSPLPSGRTTYRTYDDIQNELEALVRDYPGIVRKVVMPKQSFQGREIDGVEISENVHASDDGKPVYLVVALHHAREWPAAEAAMELALMLAQGYGSDSRITSLLKRERVIVVPLINPDGFIFSRSAVDPGDTLAYGVGVNPTVFGANAQLVEAIAPPGGNFAYRRKNCAGAIPSGNVPCQLQWGVDPNRNYGEGWGGPGASTDPLTQSYRGTGPWSEPETQNVHEFSQTRQITSLITLHNVAALVLRPPGLQQNGKAPDEARLKHFGDAMARETGYVSQYGFELYDTSGTTEDWNYAAQGTYGYTIEIGPAGGDFHMPYETGFVDEWDGTTASRLAGAPRQGLREALLIAAEAAANPADHSIIEGHAPPGRVLRVKKSFTTMTSPVCTFAQGTLADTGTALDCAAEGPRQSIPDGLETTTVVPSSGDYTWHVNPSTRPFLTPHTRERGVSTESTRTDTFTPTAEEADRIQRVIGEETGEDEEASSVEREFEVTPADAAALLSVKLDWEVAAEDYDLKLWRIMPDGTRQPIGKAVGTLAGSTTGSSGRPSGIFEQLDVDNPPVGRYVLRVIYYAAPLSDWTATAERFQKLPDEFIPGTPEAWTLTCELPDGTVLETRQVLVDRGQRVTVDLGCADEALRGASAPAATGGSAPGSPPAARRAAARRSTARARCLRSAKRARGSAKRRAAVRRCNRRYGRRR